VLAGFLTSYGSEGKAAQGLVAAHGLVVRNGLIAFDNGTSNQTWVMKPDGRARHLLIQYGQMPSWSPDGKKLAYVGSYLDPKTDNYEPRLYVMNANRSGRHRLPITLGVADPAWSPDGTKIAYLQAGVNGIFTMNPDGSGRHELNNTVSGATSPTWSPDGTRIAFEAGSKFSPRQGIYVMGADGRAVRQLNHLKGGWDYFITIAWQPRR
jgi:Tol biopolymer transport system component